MLEFNVKKHGKINLFSFVNKAARNIKFHEWLSCVGETSDGKLIASDGRLTVSNVDMKELSVKSEWSAIPQSNKNETIAGDAYKYLYGTLQYNSTLKVLDADYFVKAIEYAITLLNEFKDGDTALLLIDDCCFNTKDIYITIECDYLKKFQEYIKNTIASVEILSNGILYLRDNLNGSAIFNPCSVNKKDVTRLESGINELENFYIIKL